jgi:hypothetical protein
MGLIANQAGWFGPPPDEGDGHDNKFTLSVARDAETTVEAMEIVSREIREDIWVGKTFDSPDEFTHELEGEPAGNPAFAHAVNVCWGGSYNKVSLLGPAEKHVTIHLYDRNGIRYTRTKHKVLSGGYWITVATYDWAVNKIYC